LNSRSGPPVSATCAHIWVARQIHVGAEQTCRVDADVATSQIANRSYRKTRRGDEHECQRHLDCHERRKRHRAEPPLCRGVGPRGSHRLQDPDRQRRKDDEDDSERDDASVEADLTETRIRPG
jgi:hypothetical protein